MDFIEKLNSIGGWTLIVSGLTLIVTWLSYKYVRKSDKKRIKDELARKEALLRTMNDRFFMMGVDHTVADKLRAEKALLEVEIEQLRKQL